MTQKSESPDGGSRQGFLEEQIQPVTKGLDMTNVNDIGVAVKGGLTVVPVEGEPRILDINLGKRLGFSRPVKIRELIKRHMASLEALGTVPTVGTVNRGQETTEYYLNRKQAIFITAKSDTPDATDITIEVIQKFDAYERGLIRQPRDPMEVLNDPSAMRGLLLTYTEKVLLLEDKVGTLMPKADGFDRIANTEGLLNLSHAAKVLGVPPQAFNARLRNMGWIYKRPGSRHWTAYQDKINSGLLDHKTFSSIRADGTEFTADQVMVTPKGLSKLALALSLNVIQAAE